MVMGAGQPYAVVPFGMEGGGGSPGTDASAEPAGPEGRLPSPKPP